MKTTPETDALLIETAQRGDPDAFNLLILKYQDMLYRIALRIIHDECSAEDATQNAVIQAYNNIRSFRGGSFRSWLARVTVNASYDELRRMKRHASIPLEQFNQEGEEIESPVWIVDHSAGPEQRAETTELQNAMQQCLRALIPDYRLMVILVDIEGLSYEEAARAARIPVGTVKSRLARARGQLRMALRRGENVLPPTYQVDVPVYSHA
jgi:RNA polymerase sigma-70 factor (ECF subfamily)